jgi:hypothetical protein
MVFAILSAVRKAVQRDLGTLGSIKVNNFFLFVALMIWGALVSGVKPVAAYPFLLALSLIVLAVVSADPLDRIPASRLALWPLSGAQRMRLRLASLAISPLIWVSVLLVAATRRFSWAAAIVPSAVGIQALLAVCRLPSSDPRRFAPPVSGQLGVLVRKDIRQMFFALDLYIALAVSFAGAGYRIFAARPDAAAFPVFAILAALALSTCAQCQFGLDAGAGITRYRLLPLRGWQIVLVKDAAYLGILLVLIAPLHAAAGLTFGLASLAIGRFPAVSLRRPQRRWRFAGGDIRFGVAQAVVATALAAQTRASMWFVLPAAALWALSLYTAGRYWDHRS